MREAIFSMIGQDLQGMSFLDAFGGSGIMGIEAYSRGAYPVVISEKNRKSFRSIQTSIQDLNIDITVRCQPAKRAILSSDWDIIFLDPPYAFDIQPYLDLSFQQSQALVIAEMSIDRISECSHSDWLVCKEKRYGSSKLLIFQKR